MKTIIFVRWHHDGRVIAYIKTEEYSLQDWQYIFKNIGEVIEVKHADLVSLCEFF